MTSTPTHNPQPLVSIIMPAYNSARYIVEAIQSVRSQTLPDWELLVVDDGSTDCTRELVGQQAAEDARIRLLPTPVNSGSGVARNVGIEAACGRYIAFLDSDDWWYPTKLEHQIGWMQQHGYEFTCTQYEDADNHLRPVLRVVPPERQDLARMCQGCVAGTPGVVYDTQRIGKVYMPSLRRSQDWATWLILLKQVDYLYCYPEVLWKYRHVADSVSRNKFKMLVAQTHVYRQVLSYSWLRAWLQVLLVFLPVNVWKKLKKFYRIQQHKS